MKLCFIDWFAYGLFNPHSKIVFGGAQIQLFFLAKTLARNKDFEVVFLTDNQQTFRQDKFGRLKVFQFVRSPKIPGLWGRLINLTGYLHFLWRLFFQMRAIDADVYFQRAASAETGLIALICRLQNKRFIYMVAHQQDVDGSFIKNNGWRGRLFKLGLIWADKIICQTGDQQRLLPKFLKKKSAVVASGFAIKTGKKFSDRDKQIILWVARAEKWKRPELFISLARKFPGEKFVMICPPAEGQRQYFKRIRSQASGLPQLKFVERVAFNKIGDFFAQAKALVNTSLSEGFPNTFIQAGISRTPIISFKVNPDNIFGKHQIGFCADGDEARLEQGLKTVLTNDRWRKKLAFNAFSYVRRYHNIEKTAEKISQLLC